MTESTRPTAGRVPPRESFQAACKPIHELLSRIRSLHAAHRPPRGELSVPAGDRTVLLRGRLRTRLRDRSRGVPRPLPYRAGFERIAGHLAAAGRPKAAACAGSNCAPPRPFSFQGFAAFNGEYAAILKEWGLFVNGVNPVARTNVAPVVDPPAEPVLYGFSYTAACCRCAAADVRGRRCRGTARGNPRGRKYRGAG